MPLTNKMQPVVAVYFACLLACALAAPATVSVKECQEILNKGGASNRFAPLVAHGIHSLTVDDLKFFFKDDVTSKNLIPTINADLRSPQAILFNAPELKVSPMFATGGMRALDRVLSHMDDPDYDIREYNTLERVVHALHMHEIWHMAASKYAKLVAGAVGVERPSKEFCLCATDVANNGIMDMLRLIALQIREPSLMNGNNIKVSNGTAHYEGIQIYDYSFLAPDADKPLSPPKVPMHHITNEATWSSLKKGMATSMLSGDDHQLALYIYCAMNVI